MAINIKPDKRFRFVILFSAFIISLMAATFSVTGIATLFSGYFITVAFMMGVLEFGKIIVASLLARYWKHLSKFVRFYFTAAVIVLIIITSGGIFGYLSDAYSSTKGDYTIVEKQTKILESKKQFFIDRKDRLIGDRESEKRNLDSYQTRADSIVARGGGIYSINQYIEISNEKLNNIENDISAMEDSIGVYDLRIVELETQNLKGELGPLKYIADAFNTDMDIIVKYLIFILIFVFDPLAILLFVSSNTLIRKEIEQLQAESGEIEKPSKLDIIKSIIKKESTVDQENIDVRDSDRTKDQLTKTNDTVKVEKKTEIINENEINLENQNKKEISNDDINETIEESIKEVSKISKEINPYTIEPGTVKLQNNSTPQSSSVDRFIMKSNS